MFVCEKEDDIFFHLTQLMVNFDVFYEKTHLFFVTLYYLVTSLFLEYSLHKFC